MVPEILVSLLILALLFLIVIPALVDALKELLVAVVYTSVVIAAFGITVFVVLALLLEPDESGIEDLANDTELYLDEMSFWLWTRWT